MPDGNGQLSVDTLRAKLDKLAEPHGCRLVVEEDEDSPGGWRAGFVMIAAELGLHPILFSGNGKDAEQAMTRLLEVVESDARR